MVISIINIIQIRGKSQKSNFPIFGIQHKKLTWTALMCYWWNRMQIFPEYTHMPHPQFSLHPCLLYSGRETCCKEYEWEKQIQWKMGKMEFDTLLLYVLMNNNYSHVLIYLHNEKESKQYGNTIEADS